MIRIVSSVGTGLRRMPDINDDLIMNSEMALRRAEQELAASSYIIKKQVLEMPHDPNGVVAAVSNEFSYNTLGIFGQHFITDLTISLSENNAKDTVTAERYGSFLI